ncbi:MAG: AAA family ATPase [Nitrosopumilaceae archaeon]|jgi:DNA repair protein RAD51|uniref:AAA family ATPase n=2 Tax=Candidatus Nitrosomaritimum aestuariumsis TaxID=3342354 RepID=A0AC60VWX6_9ARCH|nr:AAA family ATPase [Nitrosopumilaceae archaeon]MBA4459678.1 AAA family ATPase [Nitrosopumilaceae archaeon]MBA4461358.1 AAA family ATPase [Nitrosopumilaceae archaeon]MBA4463366.1 AAA family ATPase [Nitrosopumilaceae archaeon]NCF21796.1 AAA family ATPase [Nitrosopumilaceae archaeon]
MISTGLKKLDEILKGGIPACAITDIYGANGTGKTQLLLQICINSIKNKGNVLFLDTTGGFRPERILEIQKHQNLDLNILDKITISRIRNTSEQINSTKNVDLEKFSLIVIDNITDLFSYEYKTEESIFEKNSLFMRHLHDLSLIAITNKIPIVITNMIRNMGDKEVENMRKAIDLYTHIKIKLSKNSSKYYGEVNWLLNHKSFTYVISSSGLSDNEDF